MTEQNWQRLSVRMIWVDLIQTLISILPLMIALWFFDSNAAVGPLIGVAVFGIIGALADAARWIFTRYRVTSTHVHVKTGIFMRRSRSVARDRIRSVDIEARLRHRLSGLRVVTIGAGQQTAEGDAALALNALAKDDALALQKRLRSTLTREAPSAENAIENETATGEAEEQEIVDSNGTETPAGPASSSIDSKGRETEEESDAPLRVFMRFKPSWVFYNMFTIWAFVFALGLGFGGYWFLSTFGIDLFDFASGLLDWGSFGLVGTAAVLVIAAGILGAIGLGVNYFFEYWKFELSRVKDTDGTSLRTRQGLLTTKEINRNESRIRGVQIDEPLVWRWIRAADTSIITTGLNMYSMTAPAWILPRGSKSIAQRIASEVLSDTEKPLEADLKRQPFPALRRRLWWATAFSGLVAGILWLLAAREVIASAYIWAAVPVWFASLLGAVIAYRALGYTISGSYLVTRSGLVTRSTSVLQRSAVSTIVVRESILQRRLRLQSVAAMTAAGYGAYETPDLDRSESLKFAQEAAPGLLDPFIVELEPRIT